MNTSIFKKSLNSSQPWIPEKNCSMELIPKNIKTSDFLSILHSKPSYRPQFTEEVFEIVATSSRKPPTNRKKDEKDEINRGNFYRKDLIKVI